MLKKIMLEDTIGQKELNFKCFILQCLCVKIIGLILKNSILIDFTRLMKVINIYLKNNMLKILLLYLEVELEFDREGNCNLAGGGG